MVPIPCRCMKRHRVDTTCKDISQVAFTTNHVFCFHALLSVPEASAAAAGAEPGAPGGGHALHPGPLQLAPVLGGDQRHRRPRRLRPVRPRQGRTHARQRRVQVRNATVEGVQIAMHYFWVISQVKTFVKLFIHPVLLHIYIMHIALGCFSVIGSLIKGLPTFSLHSTPSTNYR